MRSIPIVLTVLLALATPGPTSPADAPAPLSDDAWALLEELYRPDAGVPLDARLVGKTEWRGLQREKIAFTGGRRDRVPAFLLLPKTGTAPHPVVLVLDGLGGGKDRWWDDDTWPRGGLMMQALAAEGFAVLILDAQLHGERSAGLDFTPADQLRCNPPCPGTWRQMVVDTVVDYRRALDYLATRPEIDTKRVGAVGLSMGGMQTFALGALEPRVKAGVPAVTPARLPMLENIGAGVTSPYSFAPRVRIPILMLMGRRDPLYNEEEARALFGALATTDKTLEFLDSDHRPSPDYVARTVGWLKERLR